MAHRIRAAGDPFQQRGPGEADSPKKPRGDWAHRRLINNRGLVCLSALPKLRELTLDSDRISDSGVADLKRLRNLRFLSLMHTDITDNTYRELRQALPKASLRGSLRPRDEPPAIRKRTCKREFCKRPCGPLSENYAIPRCFTA